MVFHEQLYQLYLYLYGLPYQYDFKILLILAFSALSDEFYTFPFNNGVKLTVVRCVLCQLILGNVNKMIRQRPFSP